MLLYFVAYLKQAVDAFLSGVIKVCFGYFATNVISSDTYKYYRIQDKFLILPLKSEPFVSNFP